MVRVRADGPDRASPTPYPCTVATLAGAGSPRKDRTVFSRSDSSAHSRAAGVNRSKTMRYSKFGVDPEREPFRWFVDNEKRERRDQTGQSLRPIEPGSHHLPRLRRKEELPTD